MKNNLKNRVILFGVSYVVSFIITRIYRNKKMQEKIMGLQMMADQQRARRLAALEQEDREWRYYLRTRLTVDTRVQDKVNEAKGTIVGPDADDRWDNSVFVQWDGVEKGAIDVVLDPHRLIVL